VLLQKLNPEQVFVSGVYDSSLIGDRHHCHRGKFLCFVLFCSTVDAAVEECATCWHLACDLRARDRINENRPPKRKPHAKNVGDTCRCLEDYDYKWDK
jgi:hypothetical protein